MLESSSKEKRFAQNLDVPTYIFDIGEAVNFVEHPVLKTADELFKIKYIARYEHEEYFTAPVGDSFEFEIIFDGKVDHFYWSSGTGLLPEPFVYIAHRLSGRTWCFKLDINYDSDNREIDLSNKLVIKSIGEVRNNDLI